MFKEDNLQNTKDYLTAALAGASTAMPAVLTRTFTELPLNIKHDIDYSKALADLNVSKTTVDTAKRSLLDYVFRTPSLKDVSVRDGKTTFRSLKSLVGTHYEKAPFIKAKAISVLPGLLASIYAPTAMSADNPIATSLLAGIIGGTGAFIGESQYDVLNNELNKKTFSYLAKEHKNIAKTYKDYLRKAGKKRVLNLLLTTAGATAAPFVMATSRAKLEKKRKNFIERLFS